MFNIFKRKKKEPAPVISDAVKLLIEKISDGSVTFSNDYNKFSDYRSLLILNLPDGSNIQFEVHEYMNCKKYYNSLFGNDELVVIEEAVTERTNIDKQIIRDNLAKERDILIKKYHQELCERLSNI